MITLYGFGRVHEKVIGETRDLRVEWALQETGLPYEVHGLDHNAGELTAEAYSKISPFNQVPVIDDDGTVLSETGAILLYLAEKSGKLLPDDGEACSHVMQWCFAALNTVEMPLAEIAMLSMTGAKDVKRRAFLKQWSARVLTNIERRLDGRTWIACDVFTVADILLACVLRMIRKTDMLDDYPNVKAFYDRALARPAWSRAKERYAKRLGVAADAIT